MFLKLKNIKINTVILFLSISFPNKNDILYNYYNLDSSPKSIEFNHVLKSDYESDLIHEIDMIRVSAQSELEYEKYLNFYYKQYEKENNK